MRFILKLLQWLRAAAHSVSLLLLLFRSTADCSKSSPCGSTIHCYCPVHVMPTTDPLLASILVSTFSSGGCCCNVQWVNVLCL